jgi:hypothetical protein
MRVNVPEYSTFVDFPDGLPQEEIMKVLSTNFPKKTTESSVTPKMISTMHIKSQEPVPPTLEEVGIRPDEIKPIKKASWGDVAHGMATEIKGAVEAPMMAGIGIGLATNPVATITAVGAFTGLNELTNLAVSKIKNTPYQFQGGKGISDLFEAEGFTADAIDLGQFIAEAVLSGGAAKGGKAITKKGFEYFGELTRSITDKKQRIDFINTVAKEAKETGKTPDEIAQSKIEVPKVEITVEPIKTAPTITPDALSKEGMADRLSPVEKTLSDETTGIKNAVTLEERQTRGLSEIESEVRKVVPTFDEGKRLVDSGEVDPRSLAKSLVEKPRTHTPEEAAILLYDRMKLKNEQKATMDTIEQAAKKGDTIAEAEARVKLENIAEAYHINDTADKLSGTEWSAAGRMRQQLINEDYSLASMLQKARVENGGKPLPENMRVKYETIAKKFEEAEAKIKMHEEKIAQLEATKIIRRIKNETAYEDRKANRVYKKEELSTEFTYLNKELNSILGGQMNMGLDPKAVLVLGKMAKNRVRSGIVTMEGIVDSIYMSAKDAGLELSKRDIRDAISGYGKIAEMSKDEIKVQLRELKRQMRLVSALEDAKAGEVPLRSGLQRDKPSNRVRELEKEVKQAMKESGIDETNARSPEDQWKTWLQTYKTRTENRITDLNKKIATSDFSKKQKTVRELDKEGLDLQFNLDNVKRSYHEAMMKDRLARRTPLQKTGGYLAEGANTTRALMTSFDVSAVLRQGAFIVLGHPIRGIQALPSMFKALVSDKARFASEQRIMNMPNYRLMEQSKLFLSDHGQKLSQMEEQYMSRWAEKIPGVGASQRAYTTFLNELRASSFNTMVNSLSKGERPTALELNAISNFINVATGRGSLGMKENALVGLNTVFFAPRYVASRFQLIAGQPFYKGTGQTRVMIAKEYARFLIGLGTVYSLALASGATIETDPRSTDFGKIRFGKTRVDPLAGLSQVTTLLSRVTSGEIKTTSGKIVPIRGDRIPYGSGNTADIMARFLRTKLSPVVGTGVDIAVGKNVVGEPVTPRSIVERTVIPLSFNDIYETMKEQGVPAGSALAILSLFGMGVQTYDTKNRR